ncbi:hypothetical protein BH23ACT11_BH23ACT11_17080 [soil metagenome]
MEEYLQYGQKRSGKHCEVWDRVFGAVDKSIVVTDPNLPGDPIIYVNAGFERLTEYSSEEVIGHNCRFLQGSDRDQPVLKELRGALLDGRDFRGVVRNYRKDGTLFLNDLSISPFHDADGRVVNFIGVQNDVTGGVGTEERLQKISEELATIFESITDAFFTMDHEWRLTYLNSEAERVLGRGREELLGKNLWEEFPEATELGFYREYHGAVENNETAEFEEYYAPLEAWFEVKVYPTEAGLSVFFRDITRHKKAEEELRASEEQLRAVLLQYASELITILEADGTIRYESLAVEKLLGYRAEEMVGTNIFEYIHPDDKERATREFTEHLENAEDALTVEVRFKSKDGSWHFVEGIANNLLDEPGIRGIVINSRDVTDRRRAEQEWREAETRFRIAFENTDIGMALATAQKGGGPYLEVNQAWCDILGYSEEELLKMTPVDLTHPDDREATVDRARRALADDIDNYQLEKRYIHAGGDVIWASTGVSIVRDADGNPRYFVVQMQDITERKQAEEALRRSEARNRAILEAYPDLMFRLSGDGVFLDCEVNDDSTLYVPSEKIVGSNIRDTLPSGVAVEARRHLSRALETGQMQTYEYRLSVPAGLRSFEARFVATDEDEALCIVRDTTDRKRIEEALRESEQRFRTFFEQSATGISIADLDRRLLETNSAYQRMTGYSEEELIGKPIAEVTHPDDVPVDERRNQKLLSDELDRYRREKRYIRKDGEVIWVKPTISVVCDEEGEPQFLVGMVEDITERKQMEETLRESERRFKQLFNQAVDSMLVHDESGKIVDCNAEACRVHGYTREEMLSLSIGDLTNNLLTEEDRRTREKIGGTLWQRIIGGEAETFGAIHLGEHRRKDGTTFPVEVRVGGVDYSGRTAILASVRDVTVRRAAERRLEESRQRYKSLFEHNPDAVYSFDLEGNFLNANPACEELTGYTAEELRQMSFMPLIVPEHRDKTWWHFEKAARGEPQNYENAITRSDGGRTELSVTKLPIILDGEVVGVYGIAKNITERKKAEDALRESAARFRALVEQTTVGVCLADLDRRLLQTNAAYQQLTGYSEEELVGMTTLELTHPEDRARDTSVVDAFASDGSENYRREKRYVRKDGEVVWAYTVSTLVRDDTGEPRYIMGVVEDVTERRRIEEELRESEERYRSVLERTADGIYIYHFDTKRILECNAALENMLDCAREDLIGMSIYDLIAHDRESIARIGRRLLKERSIFIGERQYSRSDGSLIDVETSAVMIPHGDLEAVCTIVRDISGRKRAEAALHDQSVAMDTSMDGMAILDANEEHVYVNRAYAQIYKYDDPDVLIGQSWRILYDERERSRFNQDVMPALRRDGRWRGEGIGRRRDGTTFPQDTSLTLLEEGGAVCVVRDITDRAELEKQLAHQALHDPLTGLPNRHLFLEHVERALARREDRKRATAALLFLDLDGFKRVNDTLGHSVGDQLLVAVAERLRLAARSEDTIARLGGDEFTVLLEVGDVDEAKRGAERIIKELQEPFFQEEHELRITTSVGIAMGDSYTESETLLQDADLAMYEAKQSGSGLFKIFDASMKTDAIERFKVKTDINRAVERGELGVQYQPKVEVVTGQVIGFGTLVHWEHPELGSISPMDIIQEAEDRAIISSIGWWVLRECCRQAAEWQQLCPSDPPPVVGINFSSVQLRDPALVEQVSGALRESSVDPAGLALEITERAIMQREEQMVATLHELKNLGLQLSLDGFGSGYSSLSHLKYLPADIIKIDRSFTSELPESYETRSIVTALVSLARDLNIRVLAEGVENSDQLQCLKELGCHIAQGNYLGRPMPAQEALKMMRTSHK